MSARAETVPRCPCGQCRALNLVRDAVTPDWGRPASLRPVVVVEAYDLAKENSDFTVILSAPVWGGTQPEQEAEMYAIKSTGPGSYYRPGIWADSLSRAKLFASAAEAFRVLASEMETASLIGTPETYRVVRVRKVEQPGARRVVVTPEGGFANGWAFGFQKGEGRQWWVASIDISSKAFGWTTDVHQAKVFTGVDALKKIAVAIAGRARAFPYEDENGFDIVRVWEETTPATARWVEV